MTATAEVIGVDVTVSARALAVGWLNAFSAASDDEDRPAMYRTLSVEVFAHGVQMIGCDGTALFRTWAASPLDPERPGSHEWPEREDAPLRSLVVRDVEGFGKAFMSALARLTADEEHEFDSATLATLPADEGATLALGTAFMSERLAIRFAGQRLDLPLYESTYPAWRALNFGIDERERVPGLTLAKRLWGMVGKLRDVDAVDLDFFGAEKRIEFVARGASEVRGMLMPMRSLRGNT